MMNYGKYHSPRMPNLTATPPHKPIPADADRMVLNEAGGYVYAVTIWDKLVRFLILGTEGGSHYISEKKLTKDNVESVKLALAEDGVRVVNTVVDILSNDRAFKVDPSLFVLAMAVADKNDATRMAALDAVGKVVRNGTQLFHFMGFLKGMTGWNRRLRKVIANWYTEKRLDKLAYQVIKYQGRDGWSHKDVVRLVHPKTDDHAREMILSYIRKPDESVLRKGLDALHEVLPHGGGDLKALDQIAAAHDLLRITGTEKADVKAAVKLITEYKLPREVVPTQLQPKPEIWEALLPEMPLTATIRTLNRMTASGLLGARSAGTKLVVDKLGNAEILENSHIHPMAILIALKQYGAGRGMKGDLTWTPVQKIVDALDDAFYESFKYVEPTGKDMLVAVDVSGSMSGYNRVGDTNLSLKEAAAAMAMCILATEPNAEIIAVDTSLYHPKIGKRMRLDSITREIFSLGGGGTDLSIPMAYLLKRGTTPADALVMFTDNMTWANSGWGGSHRQVMEGIRQYRATKRNGQAFRAINCCLIANSYSTMDPNDKGVMEVAGLDASLPRLISEFVQGNI